MLDTWTRPRPSTKPRPRDAGRPVSGPLPLPIIYGTAWVEGQCLYLGQAEAGFVAEFYDLAGVPSLKGYTDGARALAQIGFCQGPVTSIDYIRRDKLLFHSGSTGSGLANFAHLSAADTKAGTAWSGQPTFTLGDVSTASAWSALSSETVLARKVAYGHLATMRCARLSLPGGEVPALWARVRGKLADYVDPNITAESTAVTGGALTVYGALPGAVIKDILSSDKWGVGLPTNVVTDYGTDGAAASSYDRYCHARGWYISIAISESQSAFDVVRMILQATDSTIAVSGSTWRVVPNGDTAITRGGYTYTPPSVSIGLTDDDVVLERKGTDPVELDQVSEEDTRNVFPVTYVPGFGWSEDEATVESMDVASVAVTGPRRAEAISLPCIRSAAHAQVVSALLAARSVYNRTTARFSVNWRHPEIEPGDFVSLTHALLGFSAKTFRVLSTEEGPDGATELEAIEWLTGISVTPTYTPQSADGLWFTPLSGGDPSRSTLINMGLDSVFSAAEHAAALTAWNDLKSSSTGLVAKASALGISSTAWTNALQALGTYLNNGTTYTTGTPSWLTTPYLDVAITAATWQSNWDTAYSERSKLIAKFQTPLFAAIAPNSLSATGTNSGTATITSGQTIVVPSGGLAPYSYAWARVSGSTLTVTGQNVATFSASLAVSTSATAVYRCTVTDSNGVTTTVDVSVYLANYASAPPLAATASPTTLSGLAQTGDGVTYVTVTSDYTTITALNGTPGYTYAWTRVSGDTMTVTGTSYARFSASILQGDTWSAVYRCTVTDSVAATTTVDVSITLVHEWVP